MTDPTTLSPPLALIAGSGRVADDPEAATDDDAAMRRLATWLAEVSAEAARRRLPGEAEPPTPGPMP